MRSIFFSLLLTALLPAMSWAQTDPANVHIMAPVGVQVTRTVPQAAVEAATSASSIPQGHGINYSGGQVLLNTVNVYLIWYGKWSDNTSTTIVSDFVNGLTGSPYFNINRGYYDISYNRIAASVNLAGIYYDSYSQGSNNPVIAEVIEHAISSGKIGSLDTNGIYVVITSPDVAISGYRTSFCGYHFSFQPTEGPGNPFVKAVFAGPGGSGCSVQLTKSPNNNPEGDAIVNLMAHELSESITDPEDGGSASWMNLNDGDEMGDMCAWKFGPEETAANGSKYNVTLGGHQYLLQQLWANDGPGYCALQWPAPVASGWHHIVSQDSGKCLTDSGSAQGSALEQETCSTAASQNFEFTPYNGGYKITSQTNNLVLNVSGKSTANGAAIQTWPFWGDANELFGVSNPSDGYSDLTAFNSARSVVISSNSTENGAAIIQWAYPTPSSGWKLVPVQ
jgi:Phosphate-induced protein 1 conserved region/Ricin-type beta-trefoil lectin domain-like